MYITIFTVVALILAAKEAPTFAVPEHLLMKMASENAKLEEER